MGWQENGELLSLAEVKFDVFITVDRNLQYQQKLTKYDIAVILVSPPDSKYQTTTVQLLKSEFDENV